METVSAFFGKVEWVVLKAIEGVWGRELLNVCRSTLRHDTGSQSWVELLCTLQLLLTNGHNIQQWKYAKKNCWMNCSLSLKSYNGMDSSWASLKGLLLLLLESWLFHYSLAPVRSFLARAPSVANRMWGKERERTRPRKTSAEEMAETFGFGRKFHFHCH